jgi:hypothetical protein
MRVVRSLQVGDFDGAARELASPASESSAFFQRALAVELAIRTGTELPSPRPDHHRFLDREELLRRGVLPEDEQELDAFPKSCELHEAVRQALAGDGGPLTRVFRTCDVSWPMSRPWLPAVLPHVAQHRTELAAVVRSYRSSRSLGYRQSRFDVLHDFALYRDTARLVGDDEDATAWQAIIDRHAAMLSDRRRVVAFAIWSSFH